MKIYIIWLPRWEAPFVHLFVVSLQLLDKSLSPELERLLVLCRLLLDDRVVLLEHLGHLGVPLERLRVQLHLRRRELQQNS